MNTDLMTRIKSAQPSQILQLGHYVDVFDNYNSWRIAKIINVKDDNITVSFDGWTPKYDEYHKVNSNKVAYFRSHTESYTGAQKVATREFNFQKEVDHIQQVIQRMQKLLIEEFKEIQAGELCQFVRGELYCLIDSILQEQMPYSNGDLQNSTDLMEAFIRFFIGWAKISINLMGIYTQTIHQHQYSYYFHQETAIVACFPEMFDSMCKILGGGQSRTKRYFSNNDQGLLKLYNQTDKYLASHTGFFNYFKEEKGLEILEELLTWNQIEENEVKARIPFLVIKQILPLLEGIYRSITANSRIDWLQKQKEIIFTRLHQLTPNDHKENQTNQIFSILKLLPQHFIGIPTIGQESECAEIKLAISLIKSTILEKKIKGIKELTDIIEKTTRPYQNNSTSLVYFNETKLAKFLLEEKLFEILLNEAQHSEVFKRAAPVLRFLAEQVNLRASDIEQLWKASQMRHEAEAKSVYEVISDISRVLQPDQLDQIYQLILQIPQIEYDSYLLNFIRDFTQNSQRNILRQKQKQQNTLQLMWELLQDKSQLEPNLINNLIIGFCSCVRPERDQYLIICLENIKKGVSFPQSLQILQKIIESYGAGALWNQNSSEDMLNKVMKECQMIDSIIRNLEQYRATVQDTTDSQSVLQGKIAHNQRIQYSMEFLEYIAASPKKFEFSIENLKKLWTTLIVNPIHESDRIPLLDFIVKGGFKVKEDLFKNIFCNFNYPVKQCYKSIEKYFLNINQKNQSINTHKSLIRVIKYDSIVGLDFFFDVVFQRNDCESAIQTLVQLHLRSEKINQVDQKLQMWTTFLNRCKEGLKNQNNVLTNIIQCIKELVTGIEGKQYLSGNAPIAALTKFTVQIGKDEKTQKEISLPSNTTLLGTRKYLNQLYNLKEQDYDIFLQNYDIKLQQESEEEYSITVIEESRLREKPDIMIQNLSQSNNALALSVKKFKIMLSSNIEISEILFELLENYEDIWEVLTIMPQNRQIKQQLEKGGSDEESWGRILHFNCNKKLLYCLQIFENMLQDKRILNDFIKTKGLSSLSKYYMKRQEIEFQNIFNLKCFAQIAKILWQCQIIDPELQKKVIKFILFFLTKIENKVYQDSSSIKLFLTSTFKLASQEPCQEYNQIIQLGLIELQDPSIRKCISNQLIEQNKLHTFFCDILLKQDLQIIIDLKNQAEQYLDFFTGVLQPEQDLLQLASRISDILLQLVDEVDTERIIAAIFKLIAVLIKKCAEAKKLISNNQKLSEAIIYKCLFQLPNGKLIGARCQSPDARKSGYEIVQQLFANTELMKIFDSYIQCSYWRTPSAQNWGIIQQTSNKSRTGYVGLKNLGCICYMNSLMQQLYTLPNFRDCILQLGLEQKSTSVLYQFQLLLSALKNSQKQYYDPRTFCNVVGPENNPINVMEQMDVDEFYLGLMDKLESELKPLNRDMIVKKSFGGLMSNEFISKQCPHQSSRVELFLALPLQVKNKKNIYESLKTMVEGEMLEGDNAYQCEKCEKKVSALMRVCVKQLPNVLIMALKRFDYNYETLQKFKLNDYYEFPTTLNMKPFTQEYLRQQDRKDQEEGDEPIEYQEYQEEYYEYNLRGIIIHVGTADSGHYYSLIKDGNTNLWYEFNDVLVKPFDFNDLPGEAFGSDDKSGKSIMNRSKNAYMVFYERKVYFDDNGKALKNENDLRWFFNNNSSQQKVKQNDEILQDNIKFQISQIMFDETFFEFCQNLMKSADSYPISRFCLQYFLTVVVRYSERGILLPNYLVELKKIVRSNLNLAKEFLSSLQNKELLSELILLNPINDMKVIIVGLVGDAIKLITETERNISYEDFKKNSILVPFCQSLLFYLWDTRNINRNTDQFYRIMYQVTSSDHCKKYLSEQKCVGRILLFLLDEPPLGAGYKELLEPNSQPILMKIDKQFIQIEQQSQQQQIQQQQQIYNRWENSTYDYTYLICVLSNLMDNLEDDEIQLFEDQQLIKRFLSITYTRTGRSNLRDCLKKYITIHCEQDPWTSSLLLVQTIYEYMKDCDEKDIKTTLVVLRGLAEIEDVYEEQRRLLVSEAIILSLKDNLCYWFYAQTIFDYIFKICSDIKFTNSIRQVLQNNKSVLKLFGSWLKESQNPYQNIVQQRWKPFRKRSALIQNLDIQDKLSKFQTLAQKRIDTLEMIMNQQIYDSGYDSDSGIVDLKQGALIDAIVPTRSYQNNYDNSGYQSWEILQNLGDMIEIKGNNQASRWIHLTDSSIAPNNTQTIKYENHVNFIK